MAAWGYLCLAILLEASWVIGLKFTQGWTRLAPSAFVALTYVLGLVPLSLAGRAIPTSTVYSIWVGGGIVVVSLVDILCFGEPASLPKIACILLILCGAMGLKLLTGGH